MIPWVASNEAKVPQLPGVYELLVKQADGKYLRRYIGQGDSLRERFERHLSPSEPNVCIKERLAKCMCAFDYAIITDRADRLDAERALYVRYRSQAECNHVPPPGSGRPYDVEIIEE